jgi:hypothetical protein
MHYCIDMNIFFYFYIKLKTKTHTLGFDFEEKIMIFLNFIKSNFILSLNFEHGPVFSTHS